MHPALRSPLAPSTHKRYAIAQPDRATAATINRTDRVRQLLREHLPHGVKQWIGKELGLRKESVTRQLDPQCTERLSDDVATQGLLFLQQMEGKEGVVREVQDLRGAGISTISIQLPNDKDTWTFTFNRVTGEVK